MTEWLPNYNWSQFSGDLVAGVSLACLLIPQVCHLQAGEAELIFSQYRMPMVLPNFLL